jgi:hypothetical protein
MKIMGEKPWRRRSFTPEFKAEIVELWQCGSGQSGVGSGSPASDGPLLCLQQTKILHRAATTRRPRHGYERSASADLAGLPAVGATPACGQQGRLKASA